VRVTSKDPGPKPAEALEYFRRLNLDPGLDLDAAWTEEHGEAFKVAGVVAEDLLEGLRRAVDQALEDGLTFEQFAAGLDDVLRALGWLGEGDKVPHRLRVVYETNMRVARAAGQWARIQRTAEDRPYLIYALGPSERHREQHVAWAGTVLPVDDPWWSTHFPPNGFGCRCHVRQVSKREAKRKGISEAAPAGDPDPGWDHNPGASGRG
jgi:SPP1 gp7 family putative phage head morphogenesis protein